MSRRFAWPATSSAMRTLIVPTLLVACLLVFTVLAAGPRPNGGRVSAQAEPTATNIPLVFNTPVPDSDDESTNTPAPEDSTAQDDMELPADAWEGGYFRGDSEFYGRPWTAVYGAKS